MEVLADRPDGPLAARPEASYSAGQMASAEKGGLPGELDLDLDLRLLSLWTEISECPFYGELAWAYIRAAYGLGYLDALREPRRGQLCRDHGYPVPRRGSKAP